MVLDNEKEWDIVIFVWIYIWYFVDVNDFSCLYIGIWLFIIFFILVIEFVFLS